MAGSAAISYHFFRLSGASRGPLCCNAALRFRPGLSRGHTEMDHELGRELVDVLRWPGVVIERGGGKGEQVQLDKVEQCFRQARLAGLEVVRSHPRILPALHCTTSENASKLEDYQAVIFACGNLFLCQIASIAFHYAVVSPAATGSISISYERCRFATSLFRPARRCKLHTPSQARAA